MSRAIMQAEIEAAQDRADAELERHEKMRAARLEAQTKFIRIGDRIIDLGHISDVWYGAGDYDGGPEVRIYMGTESSDGPRSIYWTGNQYAPVVAFLKEVLDPIIVAQLDLPAREPYRPSTQVEPVGPSPLDNY